jgi:photosynthesis system II assembly factor YCF48-like protein
VFVRNVDRDRDRLIERLLPEMLHARAANAQPDGCLDAEAAAAWADDALGPRERSTAEAHAAGCARCQALLAAMVRTSPPAAVHSWFRLPALAWLAPVTAVAAALIVWMIVPPRARVAPADRVVSRSEVVATAPAGEPVVSAPPATSKPPVKTPPERMRQARAANPNNDLRDALGKTGPASAPARSFADASRGAAAPAAAPGSPERSPSYQSATPTPAAAPPPAPAQTVAPLAETVTVAPFAARAATENVLARRLDAVRQPAAIISTDPRHRWLIAADGIVLHSIDGGSTWETQQTGASITLTAGASPSPSICWLVGPGGLVLLSTDSHSWRTLPFQEKVDLVSVRATDDKTATVTAAGGRSFSTTDRGVTWTAVPNR